MAINWKNKNIWIALIVLVFILFIFINNANASSKKNKEIAKLQQEISNKDKAIEEQKSSIAKLEKKVDEAKPWFDLSEKERQRKIEEDKEKARAAETKKKAEEKAKKEAAEKKAKEEAAKKAAAEAEAKRKKEEEEKRGYETGITYDQLARTPDDYISKKVKFRGKVIQVMEGDDTTQIRLAVNDNYDNVLFGEYDSDILSSRILEDDVVTIMGISAGLISYESTMGGKITIPSVLIEKIEN